MENDDSPGVLEKRLPMRDKEFRKQFLKKYKFPAQWPRDEQIHYPTYDIFL